MASSLKRRKRKLKIKGTEKDLKTLWTEKKATVTANNTDVEVAGTNWVDTTTVDIAAAADEDYKDYIFKLTPDGDVEPVLDTDAELDAESIIFSGAKSDIRRGEDAERNISILANRINADSSGNLYIGTGGEINLRNGDVKVTGGHLRVEGGQLRVPNDVIFYNYALVSASDNYDDFSLATNVDHIWHEDASSAFGHAGQWHFCSDVGYKTAGNATLRAEGMITRDQRTGFKLTDMGMQVYGTSETSTYLSNVTPNSPGTLALIRNSASNTGEPYISFHTGAAGLRHGYLQIENNGDINLRTGEQGGVSAGRLYFGADVPMNMLHGGWDTTSVRMKFKVGSDANGMTLSANDLLVYDHVIAGYSRNDTDDSWVYNTGENGVYAYSGSQANVASTTGSDCYTYIFSRTVADGSDAFNCTVDANVKVELDSNGNCYNDGTWSTTAADYAEMFEWADGNTSNEDRVGYPVVLEGNKVRIATESDNPALIIGIVSAAPGVLGDNDLQKWNGWAARDDWGRPIMRTISMVKWTGVSDQEQRYRVDHVPEDVNIPADAEYYDTEEVAYSEDWDRSIPYTPREERPEWSPIGMLGKLRMHAGQPAGDRWIKMRTVKEDEQGNPLIEEWLVR